MNDFIIRSKAIRELYSNVITIKENQAFDVNNNEVILDENAITNKITELEQAEATAKYQKEIDALAGNNKLLALGLSQAEATALTGYTPPTEV